MKFIKKLYLAVMLMCIAVNSFAAIQVTEHSDNITKLDDDTSLACTINAKTYIAGSDPKVMIWFVGEDDIGKIITLKMSFSGADLPLGLMLMHLEMPSKRRVSITFSDMKKFIVTEIEPLDIIDLPPR